MAVTPELHATGVYTLMAPWTTAANTTYECIAIRSFADIIAKGVDVRTVYYVSMGLTEGAALGGGMFSFAAEAAKAPNIITLRDSVGNFIYVPDTFIASCPQLSVVPYSYTVLSLSLGAIPDYVDLTALKAQITAVVGDMAGITTTVNVNRAAATDNPDYAQHIVLENARLAAITNRTTDAMKLVAANQKIALLQATNQGLVDILVAEGLFP